MYTIYNGRKEKARSLLTMIFSTRYDGPDSCISTSASTASSRPRLCLGLFPPMLSFVKWLLWTSLGLFHSVTSVVYSPISGLRNSILIDSDRQCSGTRWVEFVRVQLPCSWWTLHDFFSGFRGENLSSTPYHFAAIFWNHPPTLNTSDSNLHNSYVGLLTTSWKNEVGQSSRCQSWEFASL